MTRLLVFSSLCVVISGCAGITVKKDQVTAAHRVAIVGYQGVLQLEDKNESSRKNSITGAIGAAKGMADMTSGKMGARRGEQAESGYAELAKRLNSTFGWEVVGREAFAPVAPYQERVAKSSSFMRTGSQAVQGVLTQYEVNALKKAQLADLAQQMGVDALATVELKYTVGKRGGVSVGGFGSTTKFPVATAHFKVTDKAGEVIWEDWVARGEVASQGLRNTMGADLVENETEVLNEAANSAFDAIISRYHSAEDASAKDKAAAQPAPAATQPAAAPAEESKPAEATPQ